MVNVLKNTLFFMLDQNQLRIEMDKMSHVFLSLQSLDRASLNSDSEMISRIKKEIATKEEFLKRPVPPLTTTTEQRRMSSDVLPSPPGMANGKTPTGMDGGLSKVESGRIGNMTRFTRSGHIMQNSGPTPPSLRNVMRVWATCQCGL